MSNTAALSNVIELRPTTILTTRTEKPVVDKREYLTEAEIEALIKAAPTPRDRAMILVAYTHGLRVSELINLRWSQINFDTGRIAVKRLKGSVDGVQPLRGSEVRALRALKRTQPIGSQFVFLSYQGAPLTRQAFDKMIRAAGVKAGFGGGIHAHLLRHSTGYRLVNQGLDTISLASYLGHAQIANTQRYCRVNAERFAGLWPD
jgi:type 1 fimbriae regulatory protein FimB/type 1 fimbriae regulatory protein FimE